MNTILRNAILVDLDPPGVGQGDLLIRDGHIAVRGSSAIDPAASIVD